MYVIGSECETAAFCNVSTSSESNIDIIVMLLTVILNPGNIGLAWFPLVDLVDLTFRPDTNHSGWNFWCVGFVEAYDEILWIIRCRLIHRDFFSEIRRSSYSLWQGEFWCNPLCTAWTLLIDSSRSIGQLNVCFPCLRPVEWFSCSWQAFHLILPLSYLFYLYLYWLSMTSSSEQPPLVLDHDIERSFSDDCL